MGVSGHEEEFRRLFAQEAAEHIATLTEQALDLDEGGDVDELFRAAHTLKGSAALVGYDPIRRVAHAVESVLDEIRSGARPADRRSADAILSAADVLEEMLPALQRGEDCGPRAERAEREIEAHLAVDEPAPERGQEPPPEPPPEPPAAGGEYLQIPVERLDAIVRLAGEAVAARVGIGSVISERLGEDPDGLPVFSQLARSLAELQAEALRARTVRFERVAAPLRRAVRDIAADTGKEVRWEIEGGATEIDRHVLETLRDPLLHLVRNAVDHGIEPPAARAAAGKPPQGSVRVRAEPRGHEVQVTVADDGAGVDLAGVEQRVGEGGNPLETIFRAGLSTAAQVTDVSGRGVGLDAVRTAVASVRGRVEAESAPGEGTLFRISVPMTLAVLPCLVVRAGEQPYAIPLGAAEAVLDDPVSAELSVEGRAMLRVGDGLVAVAPLADVLETGEQCEGPAVLLAGGGGRRAFRVDELLGRREVVVKELGPLVGRIDVVTGAAVEPDGSLLLVLDPAALVERTAGREGARPPSETEVDDEVQRREARVLVVDDALTIRELQRSILERAGYEVRVAVDGEAALAALADAPFDLVLTDLEMPRLDGFGLTRAIRARPRLQDLPVIMITSRGGEEDRRRGLDAGASGYIVKSEFDERALLEAVERALAGRR